MNNTDLKNDLCGLILGGGKSSRMGFDKGTIRFYDKPQREHLTGILKKFCTEVFLSSKVPPPPSDKLNFLADKFDIESPLNGILTAFAFNPNVAWLSVPVDMPMIDENTLRTLLHHRDQACDATCFYDADGKLPEPLVAIWEKSCADKLTQFYSEGKISPREFLMANKTKLIKADDSSIHLNINTTDELKRFQERNQ